TAAQAKRNTISPICLQRPVCVLRRAILARSPPPCAHDDARLRLPAAPPPQNSEAGKKESMDRRLNQAWRPSATPLSRSLLNCHRNDARTVENGLVSRSGVSKSAKVVLAGGLIAGDG